MSKVYTNEQYAVITKALNKLDLYIRRTYGPGGRGILVDSGPYQKLVDDGYLAIDEFELDDPLENAVIKFVRNASFQTNKRAGDGTTTATLIMIALVREGLKSTKTRSQFFKELKEAQAEVLLQMSRRQIDSHADLKKVALSAYRDEESAEIVASVVREIGPEGVVSVQGGESLQTTHSVVMGMSIPNGFYSPYLSNQSGEVEITEPYILVTTARIVSNKQLLPIVQKIVQTGKRKLVIVCEDMEGEAMTTVIMNRLKGTLDVMVVKAPFTGMAKKDFLEDLCVVTGAVLADEVSGRTIEEISLASLGKAAKVITTKEHSLIVEGNGFPGELESRVDFVRTRLAEQPNNDAIQQRLARLTGGIGVIKVGAASEAEIATKKAKIEDAVHATQLAYKTGVVPGGAKAFMVNTSCSELDVALEYPRTVLMENGHNVVDEDAEDAYGVVQAALESGISIAMLLLNCGGIITKVDDKGAK